MALLGLGILLWIVVHLVPTIGQPLRADLIDRLGANGYRGVFSLAILTSLVLIVIGWRSTPESYLYVLPPWSRDVGFVLMVLSFVLIGAAHYKTGIKRVISHPMLAGVAVWATAHLLMNGTTRALVLFGGLGVWALIEIPLINKREGAKEAPVSPGFSGELKGLFISAIIFMVVLFLHPYFAGVSPYP